MRSWKRKPTGKKKRIEIFRLKIRSDLCVVASGRVGHHFQSREKQSTWRKERGKKRANQEDAFKYVVARGVAAHQFWSRETQSTGGKKGKTPKNMNWWLLVEQYRVAKTHRIP